MRVFNHDKLENSWESILGETETNQQIPLCSKMSHQFMYQTMFFNWNYFKLLSIF